MRIEDRLRRAIADRTSTVEPRQGGLARIEERLMETEGTDRRRRRLAAVAAVVAVLALIAGGLVLLGDDEGDVVTEPPVTSSTTTTEGTTTTEATTTTTTFAPTVDPSVPIWPRVGTSQRFDDPAAAARSFAVDFVGFRDPILGEFRQGDTRSGEVPIRPVADGPETTVLVRQLEDDAWWVIASETADITLDEPATGDLVDCPVEVSGTALAFEGHVDVAIHADAVDEPIGSGFVTGSGSPPPGAFDDSIDCTKDGLGDPPQYGVVLLTTSSAEDGRIFQAVARRVQLR